MVKTASGRGTIRWEARMIDLIEQHRAELAELCRKYRVKTLEVFGLGGRRHLGSGAQRPGFPRPVSARSSRKALLGLLRPARGIARSLPTKGRSGHAQRHPQSVLPQGRQSAAPSALCRMMRRPCSKTFAVPLRSFSGSPPTGRWETMVPTTCSGRPSLSEKGVWNSKITVPDTFFG